jgi:predicted nucleic acid-binding protein
MIVLDTNAVSELMKSAPEPAVTTCMSSIRDATVFGPAIILVALPYGIGLVPGRKREQRLGGTVTCSFGIARSKFHSALKDSM